MLTADTGSAASGLPCVSAQLQFTPGSTQTQSSLVCHSPEKEGEAGWRWRWRWRWRGGFVSLSKLTS